MQAKLLSFILASSIITNINAATFTPSNMEELNTALNTAITNSEDDSILLDEGTYTGTINIPVTNNNDTITINGAGETKTILDGNGNNLIVNVGSLEKESSYFPTLIINDLTLKNGVEKDTTYRNWGAGAVRAPEFHIELKNVSILDNRGGAAVWGFSIKADNVYATGNEGYRAGVLHSNMLLDIDNSDFIENHSGLAGGAVRGECYSHIENTSEKRVIINNSTFTKNTAVFSGGAVTTDQCDTTTITNSEFTENSISDGSGGAVNTHDRIALEISSSAFTKNSAIGSRKEFCPEGSIERNFCFGDGGAILSDDYWGGKVVISDSTFTKNSATGAGGAIFIDGTCYQYEPNPAVPSCFARGVEVDAEISTISNTKFISNTADEFIESGALWVSAGSTNKNTWMEGDITLTDTVFVDNDVYSVSSILSVDVIEAVTVEVGAVTNVNMGSADVTLSVTTTGVITETTWEQTAGTTNAILDNVFTVPTNVSANTTYEYAVTVTDGYSTATEEVSITVLYVAPVEETKSSGSSGGGSSSIISLFMLLAIFTRRLFN
jgi:predicted outer membrane repeat protein